MSRHKPMPWHGPPLKSILVEGFAWALRIGLASVFLYAGVIKASASEGFLATLAPYTFVPDALHAPISIFLPWVEVILAILLLVPSTTRPAAFFLGVLCLVFIAVIGWALSEDIIVSCSCFGEDDEPPSAGKMWITILRDLLLAAVAFALAAWPRYRPSNSSLPTPKSDR